MCVCVIVPSAGSWWRIYDMREESGRNQLTELMENPLELVLLVRYGNKSFAVKLGI
jgi:hypothetical protein